MTTAYTSLLGLALPVTGELDGTWGDTVNDYITQFIDASVAGTQTISGSQTAVTLSVTNGSALSQAGSGATGSSQYQVINCTGNPAGLLTITAPAASKTYIVINATSTSQSVKIVGAGPTTGVTVASGQCALVAWNGSDFVQVGGASAGTLAVANGGTGQTTYTDGQLLIGNSTGSTLAKATLTAGSGISVTNGAGSITIAATGGGGTVTSVAVSGGTTGLTTSGGPITTSGTITLAGTLATANGGTNLTTFTAANNAIYSTSASALTAGTLPIAAGGTGATSAATALSNLGGISGSSPTITTPTIATIKSASTTAPTVFQNSSGTEFGRLCRASCQYDGVAGTNAAAFNISSVTKNSTGNYTFNFTNAMPDTNYVVSATSASVAVWGGGSAPTLATGSVTLVYVNSGSALAQDAVSVHFAVFR